MNTEYEDQCALVEYLEVLKAQGKIVLFTALPNNLWTKSWQQKAKQKKEGLRKGFPDLCIIIRKTDEENILLFLELKREKRSQTSPEQIQWNQELKKTKNKAIIAKGFYEAKSVIDAIICNSAK